MGQKVREIPKRHADFVPRTMVAPLFQGQKVRCSRVHKPVKRDFMVDYWLGHIENQNLSGVGLDDHLLPCDVILSVSIATKKIFSTIRKSMKNWLRKRSHVRSQNGS